MHRAFPSAVPVSLCRALQGGSDAGVIQAQDAGSGKHHGPIYSIQRNPMNTTSYLTIGDWTARIWNEKNKTPIMMTPYCKSYLTAGCWSPTRAGVFYTCRCVACSCGCCLPLPHCCAGRLQARVLCPV